MTTSFRHKKVQQHPRLGIEVLADCNLARITDSQIEEFKQLLWNHGVVVVREQNLTALELKEFTKKTFGDFPVGGQLPLSPSEIEPHINLDWQDSGVVIMGNPSGLTQKVVEKASWQWHQDKDLLPTEKDLEMNALYVVMLFGVEIPPVGMDGQPHRTEFLDLIEAYNNLDFPRQKQLEQMSMYHAAPTFLKKENEKLPEKVHPIVSTHKVTGKKGLYLGSSSAIPVGMENHPKEAKEFWFELLKEVLESTPVYYHTWKKGDLIFWDNSQVMHRGIPYDSTIYKRVGLRLGVVDTTIER
jgi:taurine dioxygenase